MRGSVSSTFRTAMTFSVATIPEIHQRVVADATTAERNPGRSGWSRPQSAIWFVDLKPSLIVLAELGDVRLTVDDWYRNEDCTRPFHASHCAYVGGSDRKSKLTNVLLLVTRTGSRVS